MSVFCTQCGLPVKENAAFCTGCGQRLNPPANAPWQPGTQNTPTAASTGSSTPVTVRGKLSLGRLALLAVLGMGALAAIASVALFRYVQGARARASSAILSGRSGAALFGGSQTMTHRDSDPRHAGRDACTLVTKSEVGAAIGTPIVEATNDRGDRSKCIYRGAPGTYRIVEIEVNWTGGSEDVQTARVTGRAFGGFGKVADVPGIGDDAVMMPMNSGLIVRKGDTAITVDMRMAPKDVNIAKAIAAKALSRL